MKKYLFIVITLISFTRAVSAQFSVYHPFPDSNAWWSESKSYFVWCSGIAPADSLYDYYLAGDTVMNSYTWHRLNFSGGYVFAGGPCFPPGFSQNYNYVEGFIREDTIKHVYFYPKHASHDTLLYDFNLKVGDTLPDSYNNHNLPGSVNYVYAIDSIKTNTIYRKQFLIANTHFGIVIDSIIEGIGSTEGLIEHIIDSAKSLLNCYIQNSITVYSISTSSCNIYPPVPLITQNVENLTTIILNIYPNPANTKVTLAYQLPQGHNSALFKLYTAMGQLVKSETISSNAGQFVEDVSAVSGGVYYYTVSADGIIEATNKLVILR